MSQLVDGAVRGRYAPSPTGDLHLGNLRTALLAWLYTRSVGGTFVLRVEDLDTPRVKAEATQKMLEDLAWLGLDWDEGPYIQSERLEIYQQYLGKLADMGMLYPCYCSRAEIAQAASAPQQGVDEGPRYPGTCRMLTDAQRRRYEAEGRRPSLRLRVESEEVISFIDLVQGKQRQQVKTAVGDFILRRSDGIFGYQFAVVVDDGLMGINQVVRGVDLLSSTARQIVLFRLLGFSVPTFAHVPLVLDEQGQRMAKRQQSMGLAPLKAVGQSAEVIIGNLAASCNLVEAGTVISAHELSQQLRLNTYDIMRAKLCQNSL